MATVTDKTVKITAQINGIDEAIEKAKQLKSLLQEVKELAASLDLKLTVDGKPYSPKQPKENLRGITVDLSGSKSTRDTQIVEPIKSAKFIDKITADLSSHDIRGEQSKNY